MRIGDILKKFIPPGEDAKKYDSIILQIVNESRTTGPVRDYQMRRVSGEEIHTLLVNKADGALASLSFNSLYLISNAAAPPSLYKHRIAADVREVPHLSMRNLGTKGPQIIQAVRRDTELLFASLVAGWGEQGGPPFFFESEKAKLRFIRSALIALFAVASFVALVSIVRWWSRDGINPVWMFPRAVARITSFAMVVVFYGSVTNCLGVTSGTDNEISDGILAGVIASGAFQDPANPDIPALVAEMDGLIGNHFYITNQVNSNHLVTDVNGKLVCKYVYEPYGKLNMNLTDTDPDKDGVHFLALKKFTGQEFDYETGLYNYNARLYDQETGRFLQPDPVHAEHVGYDNYDRYQCVHSNPVNFTDPSGETAMITAMIGGLRWAGRSIGNGMRWAGTGIGNGLKWAGTGIGNTIGALSAGIGNGIRWAGKGAAGAAHLLAKRTTNKEAGGFWWTYYQSGMTPEEFLWLYFGMRGSTEDTWFGHNYTGASGNKDPYHEFYTDNMGFIFRAFLLAYLLNDLTSGRVNISNHELLSFLSLVPKLSPKPKSYMDRVAQRHDREWPSPWSGDLQGTFDANNHYIAGFIGGLGQREFWRKPLDSLVVGLGGTVLFTCMNYCLPLYAGGVL